MGLEKKSIYIITRKNITSIIRTELISGSINTTHKILLILNVTKTDKSFLCNNFKW